MAAAARRVSNITLLVMGLMLGFLAQGLLSIVLHFANRSQVRIFTSWNDGTFTALTWPDLWTFLPPIIAGVVVALLIQKPLTALLLGDTYAASLGVDVPRLRRIVLLAVILLAAPVTAYCGPVVFVGLIVPHLARLWLGTGNLRPLLPPIALLGSLLALGADFVVHLPWQQHFLHLNAILAVLGAPIVILLLLTGRRTMGSVLR
jgi:iron complex transport system permease protein